MLGKILKLFVGDKSKKDLKLINPIIEEIHSFENEMNGLSNDDLRNQTQIFKELIQQSTSDINSQIENIKGEIEEIKDFDKKEELFSQIDKLNEDAYKISEKTLNEILPKAFAVIKETCIINLARIHFKQKNYKLAIRNYEDIPKRSFKWPYTLLEKAWAYY